MFLKNAIVAVLLFAGLFVRAQAPPLTDANSLPTIVPPSPEVASLARIGAVNTSMHTGAASANIPLYEMKVGNISLPISLSYSSNGIKVNDIASRVGLGWNLVAGGSISRIVHDEDDLDVSRHYLTPPSFSLSGPNEALYDYLKAAEFDHNDTEHDEYTFSVNGMSGKFFIDAGGTPRIINHTNLKIEKTGNAFTLTTAEGIRYIFGGSSQIEKTRGYLLNGTGRWDQQNETAWFLTQIVSPEKDGITFNYSPIFIKTLQGPSQTVTLKRLATGGNNNVYPSCESICTAVFGAALMNRVDYDTKYLSSIVSTNGQQVYFIYESRGDISEDNRLKEMQVNVSQKELISTLQTYSFGYEDHIIADDWNKRFYLKHLYRKSNNSPAVIAHTFDYINAAGLPSQFSLGQDFFGYANGASNANFFPKPPNYGEYARGSEGADRQPDFDHAVNGSLSKVTYPTGGYDEFVYEAHTLPVFETDTAYTQTRTVSGNGLLTRSAQTYTGSFSTNAIPTINYTHETFQNPGGPFSGDAGYYIDIDNHPMGVFEIFKAGVVVYTNTQVDYSSVHTAGVVLEANTVYTYHLTVYGSSVFSRVTIRYNAEVTDRWNNTPVCGVRVKQINSYDPVSRKLNQRFFHYASLDDLTKSTGIGTAITDYQLPFRSGGYCESGGPDHVPPRTLIECQDLMQFNSSGSSGQYTFNGSPVAYSHVIESTDEQFTNGGTQHQFATTMGNTLPLAIFGTEMPGAPAAIEASMDGIETGTLYFKKVGNSYIHLKEVQQVYNIDGRVGNTLDNYVIRQRWVPVPYSTEYAMEFFVKSYDVGKYTYQSAWYYLQNTIVTEYDENGDHPMVSTTDYSYNNIDHLQPTEILTYNSRNEKVTEQKKYPADFAFEPYLGMVSKHIITPVIERSVSKGSSLLFTGKTSYFKVFSDQDFFRPQAENSQKADFDPEEKARYIAYDIKGNPLELSREDGPHLDYIWDYYNSFPIAEITNASVNDAAYTSFEADGTGGWQILGTALFEGSTDLDAHFTYYNNQSVTGIFSFGGKLKKEVSDEKKYVVTLWARPLNTPTVNTLPGELLTTKNGWDLYRWVISDVSEVTVQGNQIDEVRLYPADAQMKTFAYKPFCGLSDVCDANNQISNYEYDGFNRLLMIRDADKNILKQYAYRYNHDIAPCGNTAASWQFTGRIRCVTVPPNGNYTGEQEKEERDENNCSETFLQIRWGNATSSGACAPIPDCTGPNHHVVVDINGNGLCEEGTKIFTHSVLVDEVWYCTFHYKWSDGFEGPDITEINETNCMLVDF